VEFQLELAVEIESEGIILALTHWVPRSFQQETVGNAGFSGENAQTPCRNNKAIWEIRDEWAQAGKQKQPYLFTLRDRRPFAFAGLWESWGKGARRSSPAPSSPPGPTTCCGPSTTGCRSSCRAEAYDRWLNSGVQDPAAVADLLAPYPAGGMTATPVSRRVNNPRFDDPVCLEPDPPGPEVAVPLTSAGMSAD
jgi:hypothetical protein